jgi:hypothetical protein
MQKERFVDMVIRHHGILFFREDESLRHGLRYITKHSIQKNNSPVITKPPS